MSAAEKIDTLVDVAVAAKAAGVGPRSVWRWVKSGRFPKPTLQNGAITRWRESDLIKWQRDPANWSPDA